MITGIRKINETRRKQELFMRLLPRLIDKAHELGFEIRGGVICSAIHAFTGK